MIRNGYTLSSRLVSSLVLFPALFVFIMVSMPGCGRSEPESTIRLSASERPVVFVSIPPQKTFVREIAGERPVIHVMVRPGHSPATYEPIPRQMAALSAAHIYFSIGVPFEEVWMDRIRRNNPHLKIVDTVEGIPLLSMDAHHSHDHHNQSHSRDEPGDSVHAHQAGSGHETSGRKDPHVWLDPQLVKKQAQTMAEALQKIDPYYADKYELNLAEFMHKLDELDAEIRQLLEKVQEGHKFMVFHPSWGYFAAAYGLKQIAVEIEGKDPGGKALAEIIDQAKADDIKIIFVQPQFSRKSADTVAKAIDARLEILDPLVENYFENLRRAAAKLAEAAGL